MFRLVQLPAGVPGRLLLHSMPGFMEPFDQARVALEAEGVGTIVCLTPAEEIAFRAPAYARALEAGGLPCGVRQFPLGDMSADADPAAFASLAGDVAGLLRGGQNVLMHCAFGIGRTGTVTACVLLALGLPRGEALDRTLEAGSRPESAAQLAMIKRVAGLFSAGQI